MARQQRPRRSKLGVVGGDVPTNHCRCLFLHFIAKVLVVMHCHLTCVELCIGNPTSLSPSRNLTCLAPRPVKFSSKPKVRVPFNSCASTTLMATRVFPEIQFFNFIFCYYLLLIMCLFKFTSFNFVVH